MSGGVRNVLAENLTADGTDAGVRIKTRRGRGGTIENIVYRNLTLKNIRKQAITIDMFLRRRQQPRRRPVRPRGVPAVRNVTIEKLTCDAADTAVVLRGLPESPITGVTLRGIQITADKGSTISDVRDLISGSVTLSITK
jgi:hypothetical protein